jgi:hypothetical protein
LDSLLQSAIRNNVNWCKKVSELHGGIHLTKGNVWGLTTQAPKFYPDLITTDQTVTTQEVVEFIGNREILSIKDSFSNIDMSFLGYKILFEAEWICHEAVSVLVSNSNDWKTIQTEEEVVNWTTACGLEGIITADLLRDSEVVIFGKGDLNEEKGFIVNQAAKVIGVSNVFSQNPKSHEHWSEIPQIASTIFPRLPLVGYEHGEDLKAALQIGWKSMGPLRVWIKDY